MKKTPAIILVSIIILGLGTAIYWQYKNAAKKNTKPSIALNWQSYINEKFDYSVNYPSNWTFREFPDTQTGAGFRPLSSSEEIASECVTINAMGTAENEYNAPFGEYVKKAAIVEIQGYEKLNSIESLTTANGLVGYETTWIYKTIDGQEKVSLPITYFENQKTVQTTFGPLKYKTVQIALNNEDCKESYNQMLSTFKTNGL